MKLILFDDPVIRKQLFPFTLTRPCANIRVGILTIARKWEQVYGESASFLTAAYLSRKFPCNFSDDNLFINGTVCPDESVYKFFEMLQPGEAAVQNQKILAFRCSKIKAEEVIEASQATYERIYACIGSFTRKEFPEKISSIERPWHIFQKNKGEIIQDFERIAQHRSSFEVTDPHTIIYAKKNLFIEEGVSVKAAIINAEEGPVYLGKNAVIHEGAFIKGPAAIGEGSHVNPGAKIRPGTTIGPYSKVGGEVSESVIFGYSNKAHDGFLGHAVVGEWCNMGAGTNNSNLKNNYGSIKVWGYPEGNYIDTGLQFCGLFMGDHAKCGINTMLNTGTAVGIFANIFGGDFPPKFVPSFSWGGKENAEEYRLSEALTTAERVLARRGIVLQEEDREIFSYLFEKKGHEVF